MSRAEAEYREWRRRAELCGEVDPYDDEDVEWCYRNNVKPEMFVTEEELAGMSACLGGEGANKRGARLFQNELSRFEMLTV